MPDVRPDGFSYGIDRRPDQMRFQWSSQFSSDSRTQTKQNLFHR
ncbi:MAG: hypothetical protein ACW99A_13320 [Candidatus Kariarchaeaceae archaeon]